MVDDLGGVRGELEVARLEAVLGRFAVAVRLAQTVRVLKAKCVLRERVWSAPYTNRAESVTLTPPAWLA